MKATADTERFGRYQTVICAMLERNSFHKNDLYSALDGIKKPFIGRVVKELADIISIIRHAAKGEDLLTTEQRVNKAFMRVTSDRRFSEEQEKWLELIRRHLSANLLMEKEDIDNLPIFTRKGGS